MNVETDIDGLNDFAAGRTVAKIDQIVVGHIRVHFTDGSYFNAYITTEDGPNIEGIDFADYLSFNISQSTPAK